MRAARIDANHAEIVSALRRTGCSVQSLAGVGVGCPDILAGRSGVMVLMEIKDGAKPPSARRLTAAQELWRREWQGPAPVLVTSVDDALLAMTIAILS
jgi:hypothetical protein